MNEQIEWRDSAIFLLADVDGSLFLFLYIIVYSVCCKNREREREHRQRRESPGIRFDPGQNQNNWSCNGAAAGRWYRSP